MLKEEILERNREFHIGRKIHSEEWKKQLKIRMSKVHKGKVLSEETKRKISESQKKRLSIRNGAK